MTEPKKRIGAAPGSNNGGGRKANERKIVRANRMLYADQMEVTSEFIREAIDAWKEIKNESLKIEK